MNFSAKILSMNKIFIKELKNYTPQKELQDIGFDNLYLKHASKKYNFKTLKICKLKAIEANILKQTALSLGSDCAVHKNVILNADGYFDCLLCTTEANLYKITEKLQMQQFRLKEVAKLIYQTLEEKEKIIKINEKTFNFNKQKYIMGILNITPDSFSDGGKYFSSDLAIEHYKNLVEQNADIIDIGAQTTKPNFSQIDTDEEIKRLNLIIENEYFRNDTTPKSIDTFNYKTAKYALDNGFNIINDTTGFKDKNMIKLASDYKTPIILMFNQKEQPQTEKNTFSQMYEFFIYKIDELTNAGININNIIIDCGFGFFTNQEDNINILNQLANLKNLKYPILLGISRKSFLSSLNFPYDIDEITALTTAKYLNEINILRVHNVEKHKQLIEIHSRL